jgi:hypothetical protein
MESLTGCNASELQDELGPLVYRNPTGGDWEPADRYLSGNVRAKLVAAAAAAQINPAYNRNVEALRSVQPKDLEPGEIEARLGSSWIPPSDVRDFLADLLDVPRSSVKVGYAESIATWTVDLDYSAKYVVNNRTTHGTARFRASELVEQALNGRNPTAYDDHQNGTKTVNQPETVAAREKQQQLKDRFRNWVWEDRDRADRLTREYNFRFNNIRLREFDGAHLTLAELRRAKILGGVTNAHLDVLTIEAQFAPVGPSAKSHVNVRMLRIEVRDRAPFQLSREFRFHPAQRFAGQPGQIHALSELRREDQLESPLVACGLPSIKAVGHIHRLLGCCEPRLCGNGLNGAVTGNVFAMRSTLAAHTVRRVCHPDCAPLPIWTRRPSTPKRARSQAARHPGVVHYPLEGGRPSASATLASGLWLRRPNSELPFIACHVRKAPRMPCPPRRSSRCRRFSRKPEEYVARVAFAYPDGDERKWREHLAKQREEEKLAERNRELTPAAIAVGNLCFDYSVNGADEKLRPVRVFDDGAKMYIQMPAGIQNREAPALAVVGSDGKRELVNYRVKDQMYIVDRLFEHAQLILGAGKKAQKVEITRERK